VHIESRGISNTRGGLDIRTALGLGAGAAILYLLTRMEVHFELDDAITYGAYVKNGRLDQLFHGSHLIYLWVGRSLYLLTRLLVPGLESNVTTQALNALVGGASAGVFYLLCREVGSDRLVGLGMTGLYAFSYYLWVFAAGIEVLMPAILCMFVALLLALRLPAGAPAPSIIAGLIAATALAILFHLASGLLGIVGIFLIMTREGADERVVLARDRWPTAVSYTVGTGILVIAAYTAVIVLVKRFTTGQEIVPWIAQFAANQGDQGGIPILQALMTLPVGIGRAVLAELPWLAVPGLGPRLIERLSAKCLGDELFAVRDLSGASAIALSAAGVLGGLLVGVLGGAGIAGLSRRMRRLSRAELGLLVWLVLYAGFILWFEPGVPDWWAAFWLPMFYLVLGAALSHLGAVRWIPAAAAASLLVANGGTMLIQTDPRNDVFRARLDWYQRNATESDLLVHSGGYGWIGYVDYYVEADSLPLSEVLQTKLSYSEAQGRVYTRIRDTLQRGGRVFVTADVLDIDLCRARQLRWDVTRNEDFAASIRPSLDCREGDRGAVCSVAAERFK
jgi:hypothetical protein